MTNRKEKMREREREREEMRLGKKERFRVFEEK